MKRFIVSPLGEAYYGNNCLLGSVNLNDIYPKAFTAAEQKQYFKTYPRKGKLADKLNRAVAKEFARHAREELTTEQRAAYHKIIRLQAVANDRFHVYGGITTAGKPWIILTTEFCDFCDQKEFWTALRKVARELGAKVATIRHDEFMDHYAPPRGVEGEKILDETWTRDDGSVVHFAHGPNHGRMERQVELRWNVTELSLPQLRRFIKKIDKPTLDLFHQHGVSVI